MEYQIKPIPNHTGYFCDTDGVIYSAISKGCRDRFDKSKWTTMKPVKYRLGHNGYARVYLRCDDDNARKDFYVHRIVASIFCPNDDPVNKTQVDHKNNYAFDNSADNLWWVTPEENRKFADFEGARTRDELGRFAHK